MAFLDNSGDIILDAVLTDTGRYRLAKGDGSFRISKFALADDEINYANYNSNHASGSAYYDLDILQTPVLEAFTNNIATCKHKLLSVPRTNLLYLPVLKVNTHDPSGDLLPTPSSYVVCVDKATEDIADMQSTNGVLAGATNNAFNAYIRVDQGLDTTEISFLFTLDADLIETQYIIEIDNRLGQVCRTGDNGLSNVAAISFIDDDQVASYYLSTSANTAYVKPTQDSEAYGSNHTIQGPRGTTLKFGIKASLELVSSTYLFTKLGGGTTTTPVALGIGAEVSPLLYIDTYVRVTGGTTGYSLNIPVRFIKKVV